MFNIQLTPWLSYFKLSERFIRLSGRVVFLRFSFYTSWITYGLWLDTSSYANPIIIKFLLILLLVFRIHFRVLVYILRYIREIRIILPLCMNLHYTHTLTLHTRNIKAMKILQALWSSFMWTGNRCGFILIQALYNDLLAQPDTAFIFCLILFLFDKVLYFILL